MKRAAIVLACAIGGYVCCAVAGYFLVSLLSSNTHDRSLEAGMTGAFFFGPIGSLVAIVVGVVRTGRKMAVPDASKH